MKTRISVLWLTGVMPSEFATATGMPLQVIQGWVPSLIDAVRKYAPGLKLTVVCDGPDGLVANVSGVDYRTVSNATSDVLCEIVRAVRPDVIHFHGSENVYPTLPKATWCGIPVCMSLQGIINGYVHHYVGNLLPCEIDPYLGVVRKFGLGSGLMKQATSWLNEKSVAERKAFANVDHVFGRTEWDRAWTSYLNPSATYDEVGELMRAPFYRADRNDALIRRHQIYCSAALGSALKGGHWLIYAVAALRRKYPDVKLRVAGGAGCNRPCSFYGRLRQPQYARYIWNLIRRLDVADNVDLLPGLTAEQVKEELSAAEVFCLPSLIENSPNSLGEAMLAGVPCIATDVGGTASIMKNGEHGLLVPSGDPAVLADAIDRLFANRSYASVLGHTGQVYAKSRYSREYVVSQLVAAYRHVLNLD